jgi:DNA-binding transcriptional LysR family regulator
MKIEQRDLEYFAVVAENGNLGRAAEALALSQPALSTSLQRLERATGAKVVRRTSKGVELTAAGATLLKHVNRLRLAHEDILREVADIGQARAGHLRLGTHLGTGATWGAAACGRLLKEAPRVTIALTVAGRPELLHALRAGELDLLLAAAGSLDGEDLAQEHVIDNEFVVCCARRHRLTRLRRLVCADLVNERWVTSGGHNRVLGLRGVFEKRGLPPPKVAVTSRLTEVGLRIVAASDALGHFSDPVTQEASKRLQLAVLRIEDWVSVRNQSAIIYRRDAYLLPAARRLIDLIKVAVEAPRHGEK